MFINLIFNYSYRKSIDTVPINYKLYNEYFIDFDKIEEIMTDLLLKGKKLLNEDITEFIYENTFDNQTIVNQIDLYKKNYKSKNISLDDKITIYKFCKENININLYKTMINDFFELLIFLNSQRKENKMEGDTKINKVIHELDNIISMYSISLFKMGENFTIDKIYEIFDYFLKVIFEDLVYEMKAYQGEFDYDWENLKYECDKYYQKKHLISRKDFTNAIRLFIELILFPEEDKENIKSNKNNIVNYLNSSAFWDMNLYNNNEFLKNLNELKTLDLKINQIIYLYKYLNDNSDKNLFDDVELIIYGKVKEKDDSSEYTSSHIDCIGDTSD